MMRMTLVALACMFCFIAVSTTAEESQYCVRGKGFEPGHEFLKVLRVSSVSKTKGKTETEKTAIVNLVRHKLWRDENKLDISIIDFDKEICGHSAVFNIDLKLDSQESAILKEYTVRNGNRELKLAQVTSKIFFEESKTEYHERKDVYDTTKNKLATIQIGFFTNRSPNSLKSFSNKSSDEIHFGTVQVSIPPDHRYAKLESPSILKFEVTKNPATHISISPNIYLSSEVDWIKSISKRANSFDKSGVLVFVHGYNTSFEDAARRAAQFAYDISFPGQVVLYSWPSDAKTLAYTRDEEDAKTSWRQLAKGLSLLMQEGNNIYLVSHSMGNRLTIDALSKIFREDANISKYLKQVVFASPDVGRLEFMQRWHEDLKGMPPSYTLYSSNQDIPISISSWLHGQERLGSGGENVVVLEGLETIDASKITSSWFGLNHSYFADNTSILSDLFLLINRGLPAHARPQLERTQNSHGEYWIFKQ